MAKVKKPRPIRLSNRTAIGLRKTAQRVRSAWLIAMGIMTMIFTVSAVYMGISWLPAVPLMLLFGGGVIALMMIASRSQYLMLISQAICTEAASRQMEESLSEGQRRRKAIEQLAAMRADVSEAVKKGLPRDEGRGEESLLFNLLTGQDLSDEEIIKNRRREEDDELYAENYQGEKEEKELDELEDLFPPRKSRTPAEPAITMTMHTGSTKVIPRSEPVSAAQAGENAQETQRIPAQRRRRRGVSQNTAPLTLLRNDQAQ